MSKILFFGDVVGKPGRQALAQVLPMLKEKHGPDVIIVNVENMAHGKGVTPATMQEILELGVDVCTSGNHAFAKGDLSTAAFEQFPQLIRPANYPVEMPGHGYYRFSKNGQDYLIINLNGQVFFEKQFRGEISNPFSAVDSLLSQERQNNDIIIVDFHAEATSEKVALGWHLDGKVNAVLGTHTHTPSADTWIMPQGTAFQADLGMVGPLHSVVGADINRVLESFKTGQPFTYLLAEQGPVVVNGVLIETEGTKTIKIERVREIVILNK